MEKEENQQPFLEKYWKWWRDNSLVCDPLWDYVDKRNKEIEGLKDMGNNKKIIKEQNLAAKGGKYINKATALERIKAREAEEQLIKLKGKK